MTEDIEQLRQSRDEAIAELNKALETLGQLRSDLQRVEVDRNAAYDVLRAFAAACNAETLGAMIDQLRAPQKAAQKILAQS